MEIDMLFGPPSPSPPPYNAVAVVYYGVRGVFHRGILQARSSP